MHGMDRKYSLARGRRYFSPRMKNVYHHFAKYLEYRGARVAHRLRSTHFNNITNRNTQRAFCACFSIRIFPAAMLMSFISFPFSFYRASLFSQLRVFVSLGRFRPAHSVQRTASHFASWLRSIVVQRTNVVGITFVGRTIGYR